MSCMLALSYYFIFMFEVRKYGPKDRSMGMSDVGLRHDEVESRDLRYEVRAGMVATVGGWVECSRWV
jgi:hypothetical protein